ncbi:uncharacterized protein LOC116342012 [Contarinia nasturtii]|uniref:uncharacterized protein LOC116342012 n=1 Tax=Contarinia nasturtii TaxID=265458 RepID=UPI0012D3959C|nr:uncharacterized protein LOC116342012 [Contarinia nasturtii]
MISNRNPLKIIVIFLISIGKLVHSDTNEICSTFSGRRIYSDQDGSGSIQAANVTSSTLKNKVAQIQRMSDGSAIIHYQCQLELITCAACVFQINISNTQFTKTCDEGDTSCKCADYISFTEPPYDENSTEKMWCGRSPHQFRTRGRILVVTYVYQKSHDNPFNLTYSSEQNLLTYKGVVSENDTSENVDVLQSPFFPNFYPRDLIIEHLIECNLNDSTVCYIEISFSDFQISLTSVIEFYNEENEMMQKYTGEIFRPPIIQLLARFIRIRFLGNGGSGAGYRATIRYLAHDFSNTKINTHCGGLVESFGGAITMMNMTNSSAMAFDCIWLIKPPNSYHLKTHLLVRIDTFENMGNTSSVIIRDGSTSDSTMLKQYGWPIQTADGKFQSFVTTLSSGFYIAFNGVFTPKSRFAIVYTAFSYMDCFPGPEFLCENHRCIPFFLQCDGFDHCGDGSDENERCGNNDADEAETNQYWLTHTPNYFFPKIDHYPDLKTATLVFMVSAMTLATLILLLIIILYRMNHHVREQRELQSQLRTISELLDNNANNQNEENEAAQEQPPAYEDPPDYEEASSLKLDMSLRRSSTTKLETHKRRRSRSRSRSHSRQYEQNSLLNIASSTPTPSEILLPELYLTDPASLSTTNIIECEIASRTQRRHSESVNVHSRRSSQILLIPDSPPPEYTPRHTHIKQILQPSEQPFLLDKPLDAEMQNDGHLALIINTDQHRLIDIQESPLVHTDHPEQMLEHEHPEQMLKSPHSPRRHSFQDDNLTNTNFFEQKFAQYIRPIDTDCDSDTIDTQCRIENKQCSLSWLKNVNAMYNNYLKYEIIPPQQLKPVLRKTSSENELLLMSKSNNSSLRELPIFRRSFSSGLLF